MMPEKAAAEKTLQDVNKKYEDEFMKIQEEYRTFSEYLWKFTDHKIIHETGKTSSELSDQISKDLKKRGMKFVGTTIIYSYLQAVGVVESHEEGCFLHHKE